MADSSAGSAHQKPPLSRGLGLNVSKRPLTLTQDHCGRKVTIAVNKG